MKYLLVKDQKVLNVVHGSPDDLTPFDLCLAVEDTLMVGPGDGYIDGQVVPATPLPPEEEP